MGTSSSSWGSPLYLKNNIADHMGRTCKVKLAMAGPEIGDTLMVLNRGIT